MKLKEGSLLHLFTLRMTVSCVHEEDGVSKVFFNCEDIHLLEN